MLNLRLVPASALPLALERNLRRLGPRDKVFKHFLNAIRWSFDADSAWFHRRLRHNASVRQTLVAGDAPPCDESLIEAFARLEYPNIPANVILAPFRPHQRVEAVVGVARRAQDFEAGRGRSLNRLTSLLAGEIERRDREALERVVAHTQDTALSGLSARDLIYRILDALYQLIRYDHSATLSLYDHGRNTFRLIAEKIVWEKAGSTRIGKEIAADSKLLEELNRAEILTLGGEFWRPEGIRKVSTSLVSAVTYRRRLAGVLSLASSRRLPFDAWDCTVVKRFLTVTAFSLTSLSDTYR